MELFRKTFILTLALVLAMPFAKGQDISTQGKEFWLTFMHNGFRDHEYGGWVTNQVLISAKRDCHVTLSNPLADYTRDYDVEANTVTTIDIPETYGYHDAYNYEAVSNKGIHVIADDTISVYCTNIAYVSFDASFVLPVESLGDDYIIQSYDQSIAGGNSYVTQNETSAFVIIATEDNTEISILPSCNTLSGVPQGQEIDITLDAGQTYHVRSTRNGSSRDLSGTRVTAGDCKKIAVFNGNTITCVPTNTGNGYDHVFEQAMPLRSWGKNFVVTSSKNRNRDFVKITSAADNNVITKNGVHLVTLSANQSYTFAFTNSEQSCFLQATNPCAVYLFNNSSHDFRYLGDPSMVWIAPVEQKIDEVTFTTFNNSNINITEHHINIIVKTEDVGEVYYDGELLPASDFRLVNGNGDFSFTQKTISHGTHHLSCANGFNAHVYGFGDAKGYAYLVGSNAIDLSANLVINNTIVNENDSFLYCVNDTIEFYAEVNLENAVVEWDFDDGTTSTDNPAYHMYSSPDIYRVTLTINTDGNTCEDPTSNAKTFFVDVLQTPSHVYDTVCEGDYYSNYGHEGIINDDTLIKCVQENSTACPDSLYVHIKAWPKYAIHIDDSRCWTGTPGVYDEHGFHIEYDGPGTYPDQRTLVSCHGCDSIVTVTLEVGDFEIHDTETHYLCYEDTPSFTWDVNGETYNADGHYADTLPSGDCYAIYNLELHFLKTPEETHLYDTTCTSYDWEVSGQTYHLEDGGDFPHHDDLAPFPCVKTTWLHLTLSGTVENPEPETITTCDSYDWHGNTYTESHPYYSDTLQTPLGCDSIVHLNLTLHHTPNPSALRLPDDPYDYQDGDTIGVITNTEFFSFNYDFFVEDLLGHIGDWDSCVWQISKASWMIEPFTKEDEPDKRYCKVYVADADNASVELRCLVYNSHCLPDSVLIRRLYLKSSFFGLDEQESSTARFDVAPNPNNGQMTLRFENMAGKVNVKVYDIHGILLDSKDFYNTLENNDLNYGLAFPAEGVYLFVATTEGVVLTRKVVVTR